MTHPIRTPRLGDISALARCLYAAPPMHRDDVADEILDAAIRAKAHFQATGRCHPYDGDGSLQAAALVRNPANEPPLTDNEYVACMVLALRKVAEINDLAQKEAA